MPQRGEVEKQSLTPDLRDTVWVFAIRSGMI